MLLEERGPKSLWLSFFSWLIKWLSGFLFGFIVSVLGMSVFGYGTFSFIFVLIATQIFFWKFFHDSGMITVLLFDAAVIFSILMFRLYVILGPDI